MGRVKFLKNWREFSGGGMKAGFFLQKGKHPHLAEQEEREEQEEQEEQEEESRKQSRAEQKADGRQSRRQSMKQEESKK